MSSGNKGLGAKKVKDNEKHGDIVQIVYNSSILVVVLPGRGCLKGGFQFI